MLIENKTIDSMVINRRFGSKKIHFLNCSIKEIKVINARLDLLWFQESVVLEGLEIIDSDIDSVETDYSKLYKKLIIKDSQVDFIQWSTNKQTQFSGKIEVVNSKVGQLLVRSYGSQIEIFNSKICIYLDEYVAKDFSYNQNVSNVILELTNKSDYVIPELEFINVGSISLTYEGRPLGKVMFKDCEQAELYALKETYNFVYFINIKSAKIFAGEEAKVNTCRAEDSSFHDIVCKEKSIINNIILKNVKKINLSLEKEGCINNIEMGDVLCNIFEIKDSKIKNLHCKNLEIGFMIDLRNAIISIMSIQGKLTVGEKLKARRAANTPDYSETQNFKIEALYLGDKIYYDSDKLVFTDEV